jgi:hypothetical protein
MDRFMLEAHTMAKRSFAMAAAPACCRVREPSPVPPLRAVLRPLGSWGAGPATSTRCLLKAGKYGFLEWRVCHRHAVSCNENDRAWPAAGGVAPAWLGRLLRSAYPAT